MILDKGFIIFNDKKIPFVIENFRMELFTDDDILLEFIKKYNFVTNYILKGQCYIYGTNAQHAIFLVEWSSGSTCYLKCYIVNTIPSDGEYDSVGLQSRFLDDVFRYDYEYLDSVKDGINLDIKPKNIYNLSFGMDGKQYEANYRIGRNNSKGLLEERERKGEILIAVHTDEIQEIYNLSMVFYRLAMFMTSCANTPFKRIALYRNEHKVGWFYCPLVSENAVSGRNILFCKLDVIKYIPKILNNIALDSGNKITKSIPLGHLSDFDNLLTPHRFIEQTMAFEYLFDKLEPKKAKNSKFTLKKEMHAMFEEFSELLHDTKVTAEDISEHIKSLRHSIVHGRTYYYDFKSNTNTQCSIYLLDELIKKMSLKWIGFTKEEIAEYPVL